MDQLVINAKTRTECGKSVANNLRKQGKLPAVMYNSKGESTMLEIDEVEFNKVWRSITSTTLVSVALDGASHNVFIKDTEYNIRTDKVLHADFFEPAEDQLLSFKMPVHFTGTPAGVLKGGFLLKHLKEVTLKTVAKKVPARIVADISNVNVGEKFTVKDLNLGDGITVMDDADAALVSVKAGRK